MPRIVRFRMSPSVNHRYDVQRNVGINRPNMQLDVLMVQFFLNHVATSSGRLISIPADGVCGSRTADAIAHFQRTWNSRISSSKPRVRPDGVVSPAQGATFGSFAQHPSMTWTSIALNAIVGSEPNFGPDMYCRLNTHPDCPDLLKPFFAMAPRRQQAVAPTLPAALMARLNRLQQARVLRRQGAGAGVRHAAGPAQNERAAGLGTPPPRMPIAPLRPGSSVTRTQARPYDPNDPGVRWAQGALSEGERLFTPYEYSEILETMEGTGTWAHDERRQLLLQLMYAATGDVYPPDITIAQLRELIRQDASLDPVVRARGHPYHF